MMLDLLTTKDTNMVGNIGEYLARIYLGRFKHIACCNAWDLQKLWSWVDEGRVSESQASFVEKMRESGSTWGWDFVGVGFRTQEVYLVEVKTSRVHKRYGLKSEWSERSRRGWSTDDTIKAKSLGLKLLLVNVHLYGTWKVGFEDKEL